MLKFITKPQGAGMQKIYILPEEYLDACQFLLYLPFRESNAFIVDV